MSTFVEWMTILLKWLYSLTDMVGLASYGLAIILLTIIIKTVIFPLTWKQMKSMRKTVEIQPKLQELQKKYKGKPEKLNQETMALYKEHNVNPAGGCLPLIVQLPIFWALYQTLFKFGNYISDPSQAMFLGFDITATGNIVFAVLAGATTFLQTKLTTATNPTMNADKGGKPDPTQSTQKMMLYFMPFFMAYIGWTVPAGLALYFLTMNIVSIFQQLYINRRLDKEKLDAAAS
ncbi:YidC/Oxa1 family membrane protein insertase [Desulfitobacterium sp. THU1]|uniref:YidC/Oxa1 family membrane protein insertase n=1 Tax=Desulfitobacterium sp. THU1 TaxID=3138072 RepID=UPI00311D3F21